MSQIQIQLSHLILNLALLTIVPCLGAGLEHYQETMAARTLHQDNLTNMDNIGGLYTSFCVVIISLLLAFCAYLVYQVHYLAQFSEQQAIDYQNQIAQAEARTTGYRVGLNFFRQRNHQTHQRYTNLQQELFQARCPHGGIIVSPEGAIIHTCCKKVGKLQKQRFLVETQLKNEIRFRKAPVDVGTINDIVNDVALHPDHWEPVLGRLYPSLVSRFRATPVAYQQDALSLQATINAQQATIDNLTIDADKLRTKNEELEITMQENAKNTEALCLEKQLLENAVTAKQGVFKTISNEAQQKGATHGRVVEAKDDLIQSLEAELQNNKSKTDLEIAAREAEKQLSSSSDLVARLQNDIDDLMQQLSEKEESSRSDLLSIEQGTSSDEQTDIIETQKKEIEDLEKQNQHQNETIAEWKETIEKRQAEIASLGNEKVDLQKKLEERETRISALENAATIPEAAYLSLQQENEERNAEVRDWLQRAKDLETAKNEARIQAEHYQAIVTQAVSEARALLQLDQETSLDLATMVSDLGRKINEISAEFVPILQDIPFESGIGQAVRARLDHLEGQVNILTEEKRLIIQELRDTNTKLDAQNEEVKEARNKELSVVAGKAARIYALEQQIRDYEESAQGYRRSLDENEAKLSRLLNESTHVTSLLNENSVTHPTDPLTVRISDLVKLHSDLTTRNNNLAPYYNDCQKTWNYLKSKRMLAINPATGQPQGDLFANVKDNCQEILCALQYMDRNNLFYKDENGKDITLPYYRTKKVVDELLVYKTDCNKAWALLDEHKIDDATKGFTNMEARVGRALYTRKRYMDIAREYHDVKLQLQRVFGFSKEGSPEDHVIVRVTKLVDEKIVRDDAEKKKKGLVEKPKAKGKRMAVDDEDDIATSKRVCDGDQVNSQLDSTPNHKHRKGAS